MRVTIARRKKEIVEILNKLPNICKDVGIDCTVTISTNKNSLCVTIHLKMENKPAGVTLTRKFNHRTPLIECWRYITWDLVCAFVGISRSMESIATQTTNGFGFVLEVYDFNEQKLFSWFICPKPDCIEVGEISQDAVVRKNALNWEEYLRCLVYALRLAREVGEDV
jgi:hypothetical protein